MDGVVPRGQLPHFQQGSRTCARIRLELTMNAPDQRASIATPTVRENQTRPDTRRSLRKVKPRRDPKNSVQRARNINAVHGGEDDKTKSRSNLFEAANQSQLCCRRASPNNLSAGYRLIASISHLIQLGALKYAEPTPQATTNNAPKIYMSHNGTNFF